MQNYWSKWWLTGPGALVLALVIAALISSTHHAPAVRQAAAPATLPPLAPPRAGDVIVLFAPHPDDEFLSAGGYVQRAVAVGARVFVVVVTNGEYAKTPIDLLKEFPEDEALSYEEFGTIRQQETLMGLNLVGVPAERVFFLGYPNHLLADMLLPNHWLPDAPVYSRRLHASSVPYANALTPHAAYCGQSLLRDIEQVLLRVKPTIVITLNPGDVHPDHAATFAFTQFALKELAGQGYPFARGCHEYTYLIHRGKRWPRPPLFHPSLPLLPPPALATYADWRSVPLTQAEMLRKQEGLRVYQTQGGATKPFMRAFVRHNELYAIVPQRRWPPLGDASAVIPDPAGDLRTIPPAADIVRTTIHREGGRLWIHLLMHAPATERVTFHCTLSAGGFSPRDRTIATYHWRNNTCTGYLLQQGKLTVIPPATLQGKVVGQFAVLSAPWPFTEKLHTFFLLHPWTTTPLRNRERQFIEHNEDLAQTTTFLNSVTLPFAPPPVSSSLFGRRNR